MSLTMPIVYYKRTSDGTYIMWGEHQDPHGNVLRLGYTKFKQLRDQLQTLNFTVTKGKRNDGTQELDH